jgi:tetratricopeptide (TPR) repeat protein
MIENTEDKVLLCTKKLNFLSKYAIRIAYLLSLYLRNLKIMKKALLYIVLFCCGMSVTAQTMTENDHLRRGNRFYVDSLYEKAEVEYRKALEVNPQSVGAMYNLGNALFNQISQSQEKAQERGKEAMQQYATAAKLETDKERLAQIYHNIGTLMYMAQQFPQSVEAYKEALRNNPYDNETRYNLAKAMHMLKQQENQQQNQEQQQKQEQQQQEENQQQEQQEQQQNQDQQQQQNQEQQQQEQQQGKQSEEQISKENAEQILDALMQDEKEIQEKQKKMMQKQRGNTLEKDW